MKKFISILISSVIFLSSSAYAENISPDFWAYSQVSEAKNDGWFDENLKTGDYALKSTAELALSFVFKNSYPASVDTDEYITRGELAEELYKFLPRDDSVLEISFSDIASSNYSYSIQKCANAGLLNGYSDGTFKPDNPVTNAELAVIISNLKKNRAEAVEIYNKVNEKYKNLKSFTIDLNSDTDITVNFSGDNEETIKTVSTGSLKTIVNDFSDFDIEMSGILDISMGQISQKTNLYYKDNTYYIDTNDLKIKTEMDFNELMSDMGLNYSDIGEGLGLDESSFILGYVKKNDDGTKDLYAEIDIDSIMQNSPNFMNIDYDFGNFSTIIHIDENYNITSYDAYYDMKMGYDSNNSYIVYSMEANYRLRDLDSTVVDVPDDLDSYSDIEGFVIGGDDGDDFVVKDEDFFIDDGENGIYDFFIYNKGGIEDLVIDSETKNNDADTPAYIGPAGIIS